MAKVPALSSHAKRNPGKAVQSSRKRKQPAESSKASRALAVARRLQNRISLNEDTDAWFTAREDKIKELSVKHGKTIPYIRKLLCNAVWYAPKRGVNLKNAIVHDRSLKAKEEGDESGLHDVDDDLKGDAYKRVKESLSDSEITRLMTQLEEYRDLQDQGARATNKAAALDALQTANRVGEVMIDLFERVRK
ncbi:hypothetical protein K438DRAFT_1986163 [Mycena galopus ATCC 62051]|nr:hypothetical protein K438DRAFT_1986163 [Mycena galopus ATCC 62051]